MANFTTIYGRNSVKEFLNNNSSAAGTLLLSLDEKKSLAISLEKKASNLGLRVKKVPRRELDELLPELNHQGVVLKLREDPTLNKHIEWQDILEQEIEQGKKPRVVLLDRVQDPGNLGAIVRSAAQFGISMIFLPKNKAAAFTSAARKTACGGDNYLHIIQVNNLSELINKLKKMGFWIAAACADGDTKLWDLEPDTPFAIILGSEGDGVRRLLQEESDYRLSIPTLNKIDSLNVSVSAGIIFYEMHRYDFFLKAKASGKSS